MGRDLDVVTLTGAEYDDLMFDAARYRFLRRKFAIVGGGGGAEFHALNLPRPTYIAPDAAAELDAAIDATVCRRCGHKHRRLDREKDKDLWKKEAVWVAVEKYIHGRVVDWGGKTKANVHLELEDGTTLKVAATQNLLAQEEQNRLYRPALLHINAEENLLTGAIRNPVLLAFETHQPRFDEAEFAAMVERGTAAWSGVQNATEWLEELRGGRA